ncbi:superoxide dismutase family protein [Paenibacillus eucommiae]|uniref:Superoxide dismutase [Cu-Zn] n=1 Tax=Paenibacillus eucommiae TaxID=1355755 RepID=A0ABS4IQP1_9BACL|nr:superoxide dismutase family protein [Paenibacillus eucommiae]MBP1989892.1 Cu-Zn family superoxide dismutase [Paenibacillus eucommiae]
MKKSILFATFLLILATWMTGCASKETAATLAEPPINKEITIDLINSKGLKVGTAHLTQLIKGVKIDVEAASLTPGKHGIHFHDTGKCEAPDFKTAGSHFNPGAMQHGFDNPNGYHEGDLPNLDVAADGKAKAEFFSTNVTLEKGKPNSLLKDGGTALVIHDKADDLKTDPSGNSGDRIACGVIQ